MNNIFWIKIFAFILLSMTLLAAAVEALSYTETLDESKYMTSLSPSSSESSWICVIPETTPQTQRCTEPSVTTSYAEPEVTTSAPETQPTTSVVEEEVTEPESPKEEDPDTECYIYLTDSEKRMLATLIYLEAGGESFECQKAVTSAVINRVTTSGMSLYEVIYAKNQFEPAPKISSSSPSESTIKAVEEICMYGPTIPEYVTYFRASYYHSWSEYLVDYMDMENVYFSYDIRVKEAVEK